MHFETPELLTEAHTSIDHYHQQNNIPNKNYDSLSRNVLHNKRGNRNW